MEGFLLVIRSWLIRNSERNMDRGCNIAGSFQMNHLIIKEDMRP